MVWIVVKDLKQAVKFYIDTVGLKLMEQHEEFGWAELQGHEEGARLGLAQANMENNIKPGQNAVVTFTVENLEKAIDDLKKKGCKCLGDVQEVPGHVKLQLAIDNDGNHFQLVQLLFK